MKNPIRLLAASAALLTLAACGGGNGKARTQLQVVHAAADAPAVNVRADSATLVSGLEFAAATGYQEVDAGEYRLRVDGIVPGGTATVIDTTATLESGTRYTVLAGGRVGDGSIGPLIASVPDDAPAAGQARAQVVHAAAGAPEVDVYVTAPGADLSGGPLGTAEFGETIGPASVPAGDYRIRVTQAGSSNVVFDSGTIALAAGADLLIAAIDNVGPGDSPVRLVVADGTGSSQLLDEDTPAAVRAGHYSPDAGTVDVVADNAVTLFNNVDYTEVTAFAEVTPADYLIDVTPDGSGSPAIDDAPLGVAAGSRYTAFAVGLAAGTPALTLVAVEDELRAVATEARLRVVHAASQAPNVDVYLTDQSTMAGELGGLDPVLVDVPFEAVSDFLSVAGADYRVFVTGTGSTAVAIGPVDLTLADGGVYTIVARDLDTGAPTFTAEVIDDTP